MVSGDNLTDAQADLPERPAGGELPASIRSAPGASATRPRENVGKPFAIVLDNKVISAPVIREPILGGSGIISRQLHHRNRRNDLALLLRAGALPAPLTVLEERTVGPELGADSIHAGKLASIIGLVAGRRLHDAVSTACSASSPTSR